MKSLFWLVALLFFFGSCRELVVHDFPSFEKKLTVNSFIVAGETFQMHVSYAAKLDTARLEVVDNASIDLYVDNDFVQQLTYVGEGVYNSGIIVEPLKKYTCKVKVPEFEELECHQLLPLKPVIINIEHINIAGKDEEGTSYPAVKITFNNDIIEKGYYEIEIRCNRHGYDKIVEIHTITDPVILNEGIPIALFSNELIEDSLYTLLLNYTTNAAGFRKGVWLTHIYPFVVELRKVSYDYYRFKKQLYLYDEGRYADGIITSMTNANLYSNVDNGYGIFAGYSSFVSDTITPNLEGYYD